MGVFRLLAVSSICMTLEVPGCWLNRVSSRNRRKRWREAWGSEEKWTPLFPRRPSAVSRLRGEAPLTREARTSNNIGGTASKLGLLVLAQYHLSLEYRPRQIMANQIRHADHNTSGWSANRVALRKIVRAKCKLENSRNVDLVGGEVVNLQTGPSGLLNEICPRRMLPEAQLRKLRQETAFHSFYELVLFNMFSR